MGLIQAFKGEVVLTSAEQGKEFIYCDVFDKNTLVMKGTKRVTPIYNNRYADDNIITPESRLIVTKEQALLVVENGKIIDFSAEAGIYTFKSDSEPSLFEGELKGLSSSFSKIGKHFSYGERVDNDKYAYYVNLKEITDNKFGMGNVPFRDAQLGFTIQLKGFGVYSYKIEDPLIFFANVAVNMKDRYVVGDLDEQLKEEFQRAIKVATGNLSFSGISYGSITEHTEELARSMDKILDEEWGKKRGLTVVSISFISVKTDETSIKKSCSFSNSMTIKIMWILRIIP